MEWPGGPKGCQFCPRRLGWGKVKATHIITVGSWAMTNPWMPPRQLWLPTASHDFDKYLSIHLSSFSLNEFAGIKYPIYFTCLNKFQPFDPSEPVILKEKSVPLWQNLSKADFFGLYSFLILIVKVILKMAALDFIIQLAAATQSMSLSVSRLWYLPPWPL